MVTHSSTDIVEAGYVHIDNVVYHLDDIEVDANGKCSWTDVANALTHIKLCIERPDVDTRASITIASGEAARAPERDAIEAEQSERRRVFGPFPWDESASAGIRHEIETLRQLSEIERKARHTQSTWQVIRDIAYRLEAAIQSDGAAQAGRDPYTDDLKFANEQNIKVARKYKASLAECDGQMQLAMAEIDRIRAAIFEIQKATLEGRVCNDVAWFDGITTLHDFCDLTLNGPDDGSPVSSTQRACQVCGETSDLKCGPSRFGAETWACKDCWEPEGPTVPSPQLEAGSVKHPSQTRQTETATDVGTARDPS